VSPSHEQDELITPETVLTEPNLGRDLGNEFVDTIRNAERLSVLSDPFGTESVHEA